MRHKGIFGPGRDPQLDGDCTRGQKILICPGGFWETFYMELQCMISCNGAPCMAILKRYLDISHTRVPYIFRKVVIEGYFMCKQLVYSNENLLYIATSS